MPRKRRTKHPAETIIAAIKDSAGILTTIGTRLGVTRNTVDYYLKLYPSVAVAYKNEVESVGDFVEAVILKDIKAESIETAKWYAKNKLKHRGYVERHEFVEVKEMTDSELVDFIQERTGTAGRGAEDRGAAQDSERTLH